MLEHVQRQTSHSEHQWMQAAAWVCRLSILTDTHLLMTSAIACLLARDYLAVLLSTPQPKNRYLSTHCTDGNPLAAQRHGHSLHRYNKTAVYSGSGSQQPKCTEGWDHPLSFTEWQTC